MSPSPFETVITIVASVLAVAAVGYLLYALLKPEKF